MSFISKLASLINEKNQIQYLNIDKLLTQYGMFQAKIYKHNKQEYLVIMNLKFFETKAPIFYIHSDAHACNALDEFCDCHYPISVALKMIHQDGGLILYSSQDSQNIDRLLQEIHAKKLQSPSQVMIGTNIKSALKGYRGEFLTIDFILKNLKISNLQLVSDNPKIIFIIKQRGINIVNYTPTISFNYGDNKPYSNNETIEAAKTIPFEYPKKI